MHDIVSLESRGVPGLFVLSERFATAAEAQGRALGMDPSRVFVAHPIQDRTEEEIQALADAAIDDILDALTEARGPRGRSDE